MTSENRFYGRFGLKELEALEDSLKFFFKDDVPDKIDPEYAEAGRSLLEEVHQAGLLGG